MLNLDKDTVVFRRSDVVKGKINPILRKELDALDEHELKLQSEDLPRGTALERGTYIHKKIEEEVTNFLLEPTTFCSKKIDEHKDKMGLIELEKRLYAKLNDQYYYATKLDFICKFNKAHMGMLIIDYKTGKKYDHHLIDAGALVDAGRQNGYNVEWVEFWYEDKEEVVKFDINKALEAWNECKKNFITKLENQSPVDNNFDPILEKYAKLKIQEKDIKNELESLTIEVFDKVKEKGGNIKDDKLGQFFLQQRKTGGDFELKKSELSHLKEYLKGLGVFKEYFEYKEEKTSESLVFKGL